MKNYFGRLASARSGRGVLRPPRMVFGASPQVAVAEPVSASRGTMAVSSKGAKAVVERAARPPASTANAVVGEKKAPPPMVTPVLRREAAKVRGDAGKRADLKQEEPKMRPVVGRVEAETSVKAPDAGPILKPVADTQKAEENVAPERRVAHSPPVQAEMVDAVASAPRGDDVPLRPSIVVAPAMPDPRSMPAVPPVASPPVEDHAAKKPSAVLRPVMPVPLSLPAVALRSLAELPRQEQPKIEIGTIEVRIATPQKRGLGQTMRTAEPPARAGTLARGFFHSFGIRQG